MFTKKKLALLLSELKTFENPKFQLEQYQTDSEIASDALWDSYLQGDINKKIITDLGCGTGIFGLGALLLGAKKVYFVDVDKEALNIAKQNKSYLEKKLGKKFNASFINKDIKDFKLKSEVIIQNPPFGTKKLHADKLFLLKAMKLANTIYSFHKLSSAEFIKRFLEDNGFKLVYIKKIKFPLRLIFTFHKKKKYMVDVGYFKFKKK